MTFSSVFCADALRFGDIAVLHHLLEDVPPAGFVPFLHDHSAVGFGDLKVLVVIERLVLRRVLDDGGEAGAFDEVELGDVLAEIVVRRGLDAGAVVAEVDDVAICLEDLLLALNLFEVQGAEDLGDLALDGNVVLARDVLDELLGDGGTAARLPGDHVVDRAGGSVPVDAVVGLKALVLDRDERAVEVERDLAVRDGDRRLRTGQAHIRELDWRSDAVDAVLLVGVAHVIEPRGGVPVDGDDGRGVDFKVEIVIDIDREDGSDDDPGDQADQENGEQDIEEIGKDAENDFSDDSEDVQYFPAPVDLLAGGFVHFGEFDLSETVMGILYASNLNHA